MAGDPDAFSNLVAGASRIAVHDQGAWLEPFGPLKLELTRPDEVAELLELLRDDEVTDICCMCQGAVAVQIFDNDGTILGTVAIDGGWALKWATWPGSARLVGGEALLDWLASHGFPEPRERELENARRRAQWDAERDAWLSAIPPVLTPMIDSITGVIADGDTGDEDIYEVSAEERCAEANLLLDAAYGTGSAGRAARHRALLSWIAADNRENQDIRYTFPAELLHPFPVPEILDTVSCEPLTSTAWSGAAWYLGQRWLPAYDTLDMSGVSDGQWAQLLEVAQSREPRRGEQISHLEQLRRATWPPPSIKGTPVRYLSDRPAGGRW